VNNLIASGVQVGDVVWILSGVPKNVTVFVLALVSRVVHRSHAHAPLASLSASLGFDAPALPPQQGPRQEIGWWWWCHLCRGRRRGGPLPIGLGPSRTSRWIGSAPVGALRELRDGDGVDLY
jgi:hypothetical protein